MDKKKAMDADWNHVMGIEPEQENDMEAKFTPGPWELSTGSWPAERRNIVHVSYPARDKEARYKWTQGQVSAPGNEKIQRDEAKSAARRITLYYL